MARIEGVNLPANKRIEYGLTYLFGIGLKSSQDILRKLEISFDKRVKELSDHEVAAIQQEIGANYKAEGDLRKETKLNIQRLQEIKQYRGDRHRRRLPTRGQRTSTNARTRKGRKKAGGAVSLKRKVTNK